MRNLNWLYLSLSAVGKILPEIFCVVVVLVVFTRNLITALSHIEFIRAQFSQCIDFPIKLTS
jgi:hypothetical protein